jgi:hypothetical protein
LRHCTISIEADAYETINTLEATPVRSVSITMMCVCPRRMTLLAGLMLVGSHGPRAAATHADGQTQEDDER